MLPRFRLVAACAALLLVAPAFAQMEPEAPHRASAMPPSDQPYASYWYPNTLLDWSPASDPDAPYNRSAVPLRARRTVPGLQANDHVRLGEGRVNPLSAFAPTSGNPSQGALGFDYYTFGYWPYTDLLVFWGGSAGEGLILAPNPGVTDAAHRHGVAVLGTVFFPPTAFGGQIQWVRDFVQRDGDTFPVADKLIEVAEYYGFEGWFINQETAGGNAALAADLQDLMIYVQEQSDLRIEWYDAMTESGSIFWQEQLNAQNDAFFQQGNVRVSDDMFLDFGWTSTKLDASRAYAQSLGRDPYDLYAGVDYQARRLGIAGSVGVLFPEGQPHRLSLGIYRPDETSDPDYDTYWAAEQALWVGADGDPSRPDAGWKGIGHYVPAATSIDALPFMTHFGPGQGYGYFVDGVDRAPADWAETGWHNLSLQDLQPTWRWWVETAGTPVEVAYDFETAYDGGASLRLAGDVSADQHLHLFQTDLDLTGTTKLDIAYRLPAAGPTSLQVGLIFADDLDGVTLLDLSGQQAGWQLETLDLGAYAGRTLAGLSLWVPASAGPGFAVNVGRLGVYETHVIAGRALRRDGRAPRRGDAGDADAAPPLGRPEPAPSSATRSTGSFPVGSASSSAALSTTAYFVPALRRIAGQAEIPVEVVAVGPTGQRSAAGTTTVNAFEPPIAAASPSPADDAAGIPLGTRLTWAGAPGATERTLYFGTSPTPPEIGVLAGTVFSPGPLAPNTTYYWRVDEANDAGTTPGPLWSFTTGSAPGTGDAALAFDGTTDFVDLGNGDARARHRHGDHARSPRPPVGVAQSVLRRQRAQQGAERPRQRLRDPRRRERARQPASRVGLVARDHGAHRHARARRVAARRRHLRRGDDAALRGRGGGRFGRRCLLDCRCDGGAVDRQLGAQPGAHLPRCHRRGAHLEPRALGRRDPDDDGRRTRRSLHGLRRQRARRLLAVRRGERADRRRRDARGEPRHAGRLHRRRR